MNRRTKILAVLALVLPIAITGPIAAVWWLYDRLSRGKGDAMK